MKYFLKILSGCYFVGAILHLLDILSLRQDFSTLNETWKLWTIFLFAADSFVAVGLWRRSKLGIIGFIIIAVLQLIAYTAFRETFGSQSFLIVFHVLTISIFVGLFLSDYLKNEES